MTTSITLTDPAAVVTAGNRRFTDALKAGDIDTMTNCYTEDGAILPPGTDMMSGHDAIARFWGGAIDAGVASAELRTVEAAIAGDTIMETGQYKLHARDGREFDHGKYVVIWKQEGGDWKLHRDIWNSSVAPQG